LYLQKSDLELSFDEVILLNMIVILMNRRWK